MSANNKNLPDSDDEPLSKKICDEKRRSSRRFSDTSSLCSSEKSKCSSSKNSSKDVDGQNVSI